MLEPFGTYIALVFTMMILSFALYKENRFFRFAEYTAIAASLGNGVVVALRYMNSTFVQPPLQTGGMSYLYLVAVLFAALLFIQYNQHYRWVARYPMAIIVGVGLGVAARTSLETEVVKQVWAAMTPITSVNNVISLVITVTVMLYFLMTPKFNNTSGKALMMAAQAFLFVLFGAKLASAIPMYVAWASGRIQFILGVLGLL
jgi:hypothetical protein